VGLAWNWRGEDVECVVGIVAALVVGSVAGCVVWRRSRVPVCCGGERGGGVLVQ